MKTLQPSVNFQFYSCAWASFHCYVPLHLHSFEFNCRALKVGLADHMMCNTAIRYNVSDKYNLGHTASGSRLFAQLLDHWISTPAISVYILSVTWDLFKLCIISLFTNFHNRKIAVHCFFSQK